GSQDRDGADEEDDEDRQPRPEAEHAALDEDLERRVVQMAAVLLERVRRGIAWIFALDPTWPYAEHRMVARHRQAAPPHQYALPRGRIVRVHDALRAMPNPGGREHHRPPD